MFYLLNKNLLGPFQLQDPDICEGDIGAQGPIIAHALRSISLTGRTSRQFCNALFGMCDVEPVEPYNVTFPSSGSMLYESKVRRKTKPGDRKPFHVIHLSDVHIDREYSVSTACPMNDKISSDSFPRWDLRQTVRNTYVAGISRGTVTLISWNQQSPTAIDAVTLQSNLLIVCYMQLTSLYLMRNLPYPVVMLWIVRLVLNIIPMLC